MEPNRESFTCFHGCPIIAEAVGELESKRFGVKPHRCIHIRNKYGCIAAGDHRFGSFLVPCSPSLWKMERATREGHFEAHAKTLASDDRSGSRLFNADLRADPRSTGNRDSQKRDRTGNAIAIDAIDGEVTSCLSEHCTRSL